MNTILTGINSLMKSIVDSFEESNPGWLSNYFYAEQLLADNKLILFTDTNTDNYDFNFNDQLGNYFYIRSLDGFVNYLDSDNSYDSCNKKYNLTLNLRIVFVFDINYSHFLLEKKLRSLLKSNSDVTLMKFSWNKSLIALEETNSNYQVKNKINIIALDLIYNINETYFDDYSNILTDPEVNCNIPLCQNCTSALFKFKDKLNLPADII